MAQSDAATAVGETAGAGGSETPAAEDRFARRAVDPEVFRTVLRDALDVVRGAGVPVAIIGGLASAVHGRARGSHDIDLFVRARDAERAIEALAAAGFETQQTYPEWLSKAVRDGVLVDVIFRAHETMYLDDAALERVVEADFEGVPIPVASAEDLLLMKIASAGEATPHYWYDALSLISYGEIDWDYLLARAHLAPRRLLSLLVYAESNDMLIPAHAVRTLVQRIYGVGERR